MKIYISGKITGLPLNKVAKKFAYHSQLLELKGYEPVNPLIISPFEEFKSWHEYMIDDIKVLFECDAIYLLRDWGQSRGARIEYQIAKELGLKILFEGEYNI